MTSTSRYPRRTRLVLDFRDFAARIGQMIAEGQALLDEIDARDLVNSLTVEDFDASGPNSDIDDAKLTAAIETLRAMIAQMKASPTDPNADPKDTGQNKILRISR
jgi:hypothetical protein